MGAGESEPRAGREAGPGTGTAGKGRVLRLPGLTAPVFLVTVARSLVSRSTKVRPWTAVAALGPTLPSHAR